MNTDPSASQIAAIAAKSGMSIAAVNALVLAAKTDLQKAAELIAWLLLCWLDCEARHNTGTPGA